MTQRLTVVLRSVSAIQTVQQLMNVSMLVAALCVCRERNDWVSSQQDLLKTKR